MAKTHDIIFYPIVRNICAYLASFYEKLDMNSSEDASQSSYFS